MGAVVLLLLVTLVVVVATRPASPQATIEAAAADLRGWEGTTYGFQVPDPTGGRSTVEITVDRVGDSIGTVTRASGGRAEFVTSGDEEAIRADRTWWQGSTNRPELVDRLSGVWLKGAGTELPAQLPGWNDATPTELAGSLPTADAGEEDAQPVVDGQEARVLTSVGQRLTVVDGDVPRLVALDGDTDVALGHVSPITVRRSDPAALEALRGMLPQVAGFKSLSAAVSERPRLTVTVEGTEGTCTTETCSVTVRLVNTGTLSTTGRIVVTFNAVVAATHPFSSVPGSDLTFPTSAPNPAFTSPGQTSALWEARIEGGT